jgi:uncharacterized protein (TIGR02679 family)
MVSSEYRVFSHLNQDHAVTYRAILEVFAKNREHFVIHLRPSEVLRQLSDSPACPGDEEELVGRLVQLTEWGNLERSPDRLEAATVEEFYRARFLYQLSEAGEAAESALLHFEERLHRPGELQTTALREIIDFLNGIHELLSADEPDVPKIYGQFKTLFDRFEELTQRAQTFMRGLYSTIELHGISVEDFVDYKSRLIDYLERFLGELVLATSEISRRIVELPLSETFFDQMTEQALVDSLEPSEELRNKTRDRWTGRWHGFQGWFLGTASSLSQAEILRRRGTRGDSLTVQLEALRAVVRVDDLGQIVKACYGEVSDLKAIREGRDRAWEKIYEEAAERLRDDELGLQWIESFRDGLLKRVTKNDPKSGRSLIESAMECWLRMPFSGMTLAKLGVELTGDAHALDRGNVLSPLLHRALKIRCGIDGNQSAAHRREAWASVGVVVDRISAPALAFNLSAASESSLERVFEIYRGIGQPAYLTYQNLGEANPFIPLPRGMECVYVVENPSVVEIACAHLGMDCAPLVCTEGQPASAVKKLLRLLSEAGSILKVRADFDWSGLRIVEQLLSIPNAEPWRMNTETYAQKEGTVLLSGSPARSSWCGGLERAMLDSGCAVYEEQLVSLLLADLRMQ